MVEEIVWFLMRSGWSEHEIAYVRHRLPDWERHLRKMGITVIPGPGYWTEAEDKAHDHLFHLMMHAGPGTPEWIKHRQRNITGVRPYKP